MRYAFKAAAHSALGQDGGKQEADERNKSGDTSRMHSDN